MQGALQSALATLSWPPPEVADNAQRRRLGGALDVLTRKVELLTGLVEELVAEVPSEP